MSNRFRKRDEPVFIEIPKQSGWFFLGIFIVMVFCIGTVSYIGLFQ